MQGWPPRTQGFGVWGPSLNLWVGGWRRWEYGLLSNRRHAGPDPYAHHVRRRLAASESYQCQCGPAWPRWQVRHGDESEPRRRDVLKVAGRQGC